MSAPKPGPLPLCPMLLAEGPACMAVSFVVDWPSSSCCGAANVQTWALGSRTKLAQGRVAGLMMNQISLRSSAQMARWQVSSSCDLLCGLLGGCF